MNGQTPTGPRRDMSNQHQYSSGIHQPQPFNPTRTFHLQSEPRAVGVGRPPPLDLSRHNNSARTPLRSSFEGDSLPQMSNLSLYTSNTATIDRVQLDHYILRITQLEAQDRRSEQYTTWLKADIERLRTERDSDRLELISLRQEVRQLEPMRIGNGHLQKQVNELKQQISELKTRRAFNDFTTPEKQLKPALQPDSGKSSASASSNSRVGTSSFSTKPSPFSPDSRHPYKGSIPSTPNFSAAAIREVSAQSTPAMSQAELGQARFQDNFKAFFFSVEVWTRQYTTTIPSGGRDTDAIRLLKGVLCAYEYTKPWDVDELLRVNHLSHCLFEAVINTTVTRYFGPMCLGGFRFDASAELDEVSKQYDATSPQNIEELHRLLEHRALIYKGALQYKKVGLWLDSRVATVTDELFHTLQAFVSKEGQDSARADLQLVVNNAFMIGQRMVRTPKTWDIKLAKRGDRWDHVCMEQKDESLAEDASLVASNGFRWVTKLAIAPSVTEVDLASGARMVRMIHPRVVLLAENERQRREYSMGSKGS